MNHPQRPLTRFRSAGPLLLPVLLAALFVAGSLLAETHASSDGIDQHMERFVDLFWKVQESYVNEVDPEDAIYGSIQGMLATLDPHSSFLDPKTYRRMRESQKGSFSGLGIMVGIRNGSLTVIAPIEGTPAARAGIRSGDVISEIETEPTKEMTLEEAVSKLRGPRGSSVNIQIRRPGFDATFPITIIRDDIRTRSIEHAFMIRPSVGYVRIKDFTSTTAGELDQVLALLKERGMDKLVLDLRQNPGGLLDQAVSVSERFLRQGQMVVYTRGRVTQANAQFTASGVRNAVDVPLVVLVDGGSASASEIVAGAIQDHDRGLIVGERTWGKGLVQSVYSLPGDSAMALTTARYYTPSGRLIQRDYSSFYEYFFNSDEEDTYNEGPVAHTDLGREVHGGGGIQPDVEVEQKKISQEVQELDLRYQALFGFGNLLAAAHRSLFSPDAGELGSEAPAEPDPLVRDLVPEEGFDPTWTPDERTRTAFRKYLEREKVEFSEKALEENWEDIAMLLRRELATALWGLRAGYRVQIESDQQVLEALRLFPDAERLAQGETSRWEPSEN